MPELAIKGFDERILGWFTLFDEVQFDTLFERPVKHRLQNKPGDAVTDYGAG